MDRARELLADAYAASGRITGAVIIREGGEVCGNDEQALAAINKALSSDRDAVIEEANALTDLLRERMDQDFDGECHLTNEEAERIIAALKQES